jgi:tetratricopeptide (TPR) repeat protein
MCRRVLGIPDKQLKQQYGIEVSAEDEKVIHAVGGWHYCGGAIKIQRAKSTPEPKEKLSILKWAVKDILYSYRKMDLYHWWAPEMAASLAVAYSELEEDKKAEAVLAKISKYHPQHPRIEATRGVLAYDKQDYQMALEYFQKADQYADGKVAENIYFAGLAAYKLGEYELASEYAIRAKMLHYPLNGLTKLLNKVKSER